MNASEARTIRLVGASIAGLSGAAALASLFVGWYHEGGFCEFGPCSGATSGWHALGPAKALIVAAALAAPAPLIAEAYRPAVRPWIRGATALIGLGAAL